MSEGITDYARMLVLIDDVKRLEREKNLIITCRDLEMKDLRAENARLNAEVERLRASSFVTAVPVEEYEKLKAEVERIYELDPLLREAIASAVLASKEGRP